MLRNSGLFLLAALLCGCAVATPTPTLTNMPTSAPMATATDTPFPTATATETDTPTPEASPMPAVPYFFPGLASNLELFSPENKADIPTIINYLASRPSLLDAGSSPVGIARIVHDPATGAGAFSVDCNSGNKINCIPAASIKIQDQGIDPYILIWEIRNKDGSRGYFAAYIYDSFQQHWDYGYNQLVTNPRGSASIMFHTSLSNSTKPLYPYDVSLTQQPGYLEAVQEWINTGIVPAALKNLILPW